MKNIKIGIDFDDTLCPLVQVAIDMYNKEHNENHKIEEINKWGIDEENSFISKMVSYYDNQKVLFNQVVPEESKEFVKKLTETNDVYIVSAVKPENMGLRVLQILSNFPEIDESHIIMGKHKNIMHFDIMIDDAPHNILESNCKYSILIRKPWNRELSGVLAANNLSDVYEIINQIKSPNANNWEKRKIFALVGPTSGKKKKLVNDYLEKGFVTIKSYTTKEKANNHKVVSEKVFEKMKNNNEFLETTSYGGYYYGIKTSDIEKIEEDKQIIVPLDICGAIALKKNFPTSIIYVDVKKEDAIKEILKRDMSLEEKTLRILSIDQEKKSRHISDIVIG